MSASYCWLLVFGCILAAILGHLVGVATGRREFVSELRPKLLVIVEELSPEATKRVIGKLLAMDIEEDD